MGTLRERRDGKQRAGEDSVETPTQRQSAEPKGNYPHDNGRCGRPRQTGPARQAAPKHRPATPALAPSKQSLQRVVCCSHPLHTDGTMVAEIASGCCRQRMSVSRMYEAGRKGLTCLHVDILDRLPLSPLHQGSASLASRSGFGRCSRLRQHRILPARTTGKCGPDLDALPAKKLLRESHSVCSTSAATPG